jgi:hypothetical protein
MSQRAKKVWQGMQGTNLRHPQSKCGVLPTELIPNRKAWWILRNSNPLPPACKAGALPSELWTQRRGVLHGDRTRLVTLKG